MVSITWLNIAHCSAELEVTVTVDTNQQQCPDVLSLHEQVPMGGWRYVGFARQRMMLVERREHQTHGGCHLLHSLTPWGGRAGSPESWERHCWVTWLAHAHQVQRGHRGSRPSTRARCWCRGWEGPAEVADENSTSSCAALGKGFPVAISWDCKRRWAAVFGTH